MRRSSRSPSATLRADTGSHLTKTFEQLCVQQSIPRGLQEVLRMLVENAEDTNAFKTIMSNRLEVVEAIAQSPQEELEDAKNKALDQISVVHKKSKELQADLRATQQAVYGEVELKMAQLQASVQRAKEEAEQLQQQSEQFTEDSLGQFQHNIDSVTLSVVQKTVHKLREIQTEMGDALRQETATVAAKNKQSAQQDAQSWREEAERAIREAATHVQMATADAIQDIDKKTEESVALVQRGTETLSTLALEEAHHARCSVVLCEAQISVLADAMNMSNNKNCSEYQNGAASHNENTSLYLHGAVRIQSDVENLQRRLGALESELGLMEGESGEGLVAFSFDEESAVLKSGGGGGGGASTLKTTNSFYGAELASIDSSSVVSTAMGNTQRNGVGMSTPFSSVRQRNNQLKASILGHDAPPQETPNIRSPTSTPSNANMKRFNSSTNVNSMAGRPPRGGSASPPRRAATPNQRSPRLLRGGVDAAGILPQLLQVQADVATVKETQQELRSHLQSMGQVVEGSVVDKLIPLSTVQQELLRLLSIDEDWLLHRCAGASAEQRTAAVRRLPWYPSTPAVEAMNLVEAARTQKPPMAKKDVAAPPPLQEAPPPKEYYRPTSPKRSDGTVLFPSQQQQQPQPLSTVKKPTAATPTSTAFTSPKRTTQRDFPTMSSNMTTPTHSAPISKLQTPTASSAQNSAAYVGGGSSLRDVAQGREQLASPPRSHKEPQLVVEQDESRVLRGVQDDPTTSKLLPQGLKRAASPRAADETEASRIGLKVGEPTASKRRGRQSQSVGVQVVKVWVGSRADAAGLQDGDLLLRIGQHDITDTDNFDELLFMARRQPQPTPTSSPCCIIHLLRPAEARVMDVVLEW